MWEISNFITFSSSRVNQGLVIKVLICFDYECFRLVDVKTGAQRI